MHKDEFEKQTNFLNRLFLRNCDWHIDFYMKLREFFRNYGYKNLKTLTDEERIIIESFVDKFEFHKTVQDYEREKERIIQDKDKKELFKALKTYEEAINTPTFEWRFEFPEVLNENGEFMGFDLVVGNPPYVVKKKKDYPQYQWNGDLYTMFFELGFKLAKQNGYLNFITPRFWLVNASCEKMRKYFLNSVNLLSLVETNPFEQAKTENVITEIQICNKQQNFIKHSKEVNKIFSFVDDIDKKDFLVNSKCEIIFNVDKNLLALFDKICKDTILLKSIIQTKRGAEYGKKFIKEFNSGMKILLGEDMRAYNIEWNDTFVDISLKDIQRLLEFFNTKNLIYLRRVDKRLSASMSNEMFAFTKNIYGIQITNKKYNPKFILGLLNSKLLNFYYLKKFTTKKEDIFPEIQTYLYEQLPIPQINSTNQSLVDEIINLVDKILALKAKNSSADTSQLECDIDDLVFTLYDLNETDISKIKF